MTLNKAIEELIKRGAKTVNFTVTPGGVGVTMNGDVWVKAMVDIDADTAVQKLLKANDDAEAANVAARTQAAEIKRNKPV